MQGCECHAYLHLLTSFCAIHGLKLKTLCILAKDKAEELFLYNKSQTVCPLPCCVGILLFRIFHVSRHDGRQIPDPSLALKMRIVLVN